jgi:hypothetical protein
MWRERLAARRRRTPAKGKKKSGRRKKRIARRLVPTGTGKKKSGRRKRGTAKRFMPTGIPGVVIDRITGAPRSFGVPGSFAGVPRFDASAVRVMTPERLAEETNMGATRARSLLDET